MTNYEADMGEHRKPQNQTNMETYVSKTSHTISYTMDYFYVAIKSKLNHSDGRTC